MEAADAVVADVNYYDDFDGDDDGDDEAELYGDGVYIEQ